MGLSSSRRSLTPWQAARFLGLFTMPTARLPWADRRACEPFGVPARRCTHPAIHLRWLAYRLVAPLAIDGQGNLYGTTWLLRKKEVAAAVGTNGDEDPERVLRSARFWSNLSTPIGIKCFRRHTRVQTYPVSIYLRALVPGPPSAKSSEHRGTPAASP